MLSVPVLNADSVLVFKHEHLTFVLSFFSIQLFDFSLYLVRVV